MEQPNVNNLNGIPNFGHGFPDNVPEENIITDASSDTGVEILSEGESEVEITSQEING